MNVLQIANRNYVLIVNRLSSIMNKHYYTSEHFTLEPALKVLQNANHIFFLILF